jgi:hypothetical protein
MSQILSFQRGKLKPQDWEIENFSTNIFDVIKKTPPELLKAKIDEQKSVVGVGATNFEFKTSSQNIKTLQEVKDLQDKNKKIALTLKTQEGKNEYKFSDCSVLSLENGIAKLVSYEAVIIIDKIETKE